MRANSRPKDLINLGKKIKQHFILTLFMEQDTASDSLDLCVI